MTTIGDNLKRYRKAFGHSQHGLARLSGVHQPIISYVEAGKHEPEFNTVRRLARALGLPISALVDEAPHGPPPPPKTPRTDERDTEFVRRFEVLTGPQADELRAELDRELTALQGHVRLLRADGPAEPGGDFALKLATAKLERCARRLSAVTLLATEVGILGRERKPYEEYAGVYGELERWLREIEERETRATG